MCFIYDSFTWVIYIIAERNRLILNRFLLADYKLCCYTINQKPGLNLNKMCFNTDLDGEDSPLSEDTLLSKLWLLVYWRSQQQMFCLFSEDKRTVVDVLGCFDSFSLTVYLQTWQRSGVTKTVSLTSEWLLKEVLQILSDSLFLQKVWWGNFLVGTRLKLPFLPCQALLMWCCLYLTCTGAKRRTQSRPAYF